MQGGLVIMYMQVLLHVHSIKWERCLYNASNGGTPALVCTISITVHEWMTELPTWL